MPGFPVAADIGRRLAELRKLLRESQHSFYGRLDRGWKRGSAWENGAPIPDRVLRTLERVAGEMGWPTEMFSEGGRYPKDLITPPQRPAGPRSQTEWWLDPSEIRKRQGALLELLAKFRQETAAYRAAGLVPSAEKVLDWLLKMEELAALPPANPPDRVSGPAGVPTPPTADPAPR